MPSRTATMFLNPSSGAKLAPAEMRAFRDTVAAAGVEIVEIRGELDIAASIRDRMREGVKLFIAAGGDGTVNHVVQPLVRTDATLAVIPAGTYNHFARDLGIPLDWTEALNVALQGDVRQIDAARVNERYFVNNLSMGLYPELVARREERGRDYPRWKARLQAAYMALRRYSHISMTVDSEHHHEVVRTHVFIVSNNSYDLSRVGIEAGRPALTEGRLSVYWLPHIPRIALMRFGAHYLAGRVTQAPGFRSFRTQSLKVRSARRHLQAGLDGEVFTFEAPLTITTVPQSLLVRVPRA